MLLHHFKPWPQCTNVQKWSYICFRLVLDLVCCVQIYSGTMRLTIAPPWVQRRWSSKLRREGGNGGRRMRRRRRRRVEENFYWYLACLLFWFTLMLFFLTPNVRAWPTLWSLFSFSPPISFSSTPLFLFFHLYLIPPPLSLSFSHRTSMQSQYGYLLSSLSEPIRCLVHLRCCVLSQCLFCLWWLLVEKWKSGFIEFAGRIIPVILLLHDFTIFSSKTTKTSLSHQRRISWILDYHAGMDRFRLKGVNNRNINMGHMATHSTHSETLCSECISRLASYYVLHKHLNC